MQILVSIDDTDNLETRIGTGEIASMIADGIEQKGWGKCERVTRHQLLVHPDIPYTSHNSSMCFRAEMDEKYIEDLKQFASAFLDEHSAPGSDPGLCIVREEQLKDSEELIAFGYRAKEEVLTKEEAYQLAEQLNIHLTEHGGTGQGIIGALAGAGLRLSGKDGRYRGKLKIKSTSDVISVGEILAQTGIDAVKTLDNGTVLDAHELVRLGETLKAVMIEGEMIMLVFSTEKPGNEVQWQTCTKSQLKQF